MILLIVVSSLLLFLAWLLIAPLRLRIDSQHQVYLVQWLSIGRVQLLPITDDVIIQLRILFWRKNFYPLRYQSKKEGEKEKPEKAKKKKRKWSFQTYKRKGLRLLRSFHVKALRFNLDTDDYVQNSYLYPLFHWLSRENRRLTVNYNGELELLLVVENRLYRMLIAILF